MPKADDEVSSELCGLFRCYERHSGGIQQLSSGTTNVVDDVPQQKRFFNERLSGEIWQVLTNHHRRRRMDCKVQSHELATTANGQKVPVVYD